MRLINGPFFSVMKADVLEVSPQESTTPDAKNVYLMSHINWGIHSELDKRKSKYWYYPGPLKQYYCYAKQVAYIISILHLLHSPHTRMHKLNKSNR